MPRRPPRTAPIATAPKDGTWIVVLAGRDQHEVAVQWLDRWQGWRDEHNVGQQMVSVWVPGRRVDR